MLDLLLQMKKRKRNMDGEVHLVFLNSLFLIQPIRLSVPKDQTIYGIVDMMSHIFEQYFNNATNTPVQDEMCEGVLRAIMENGPKLVEDLENYDLRETILICRYNRVKWFSSNGLSRGLGIT